MDAQPEHDGAGLATFADEGSASPWVELDRSAWSRRRASTPLPLDASDLARLRGVGDPVDLGEIADIYLPLSRLLNLRIRATGQLRRTTSELLGTPPAGTPFVVGIAGSVAVGKSTTARVLRELLARWPEHRAVDLVPTDGFLLPNAELERRGILHRKGFPESYDQRALLRFVADVKAGRPEVRAPVYSHLAYDVLPGEHVVVHRPDVLLLEGLNVLQPPRAGSTVAVSDYFDAGVYVDAAVEDIERWYVERFLTLRGTAFADPSSYFHRYAQLDDAAAAATARRIWRETNAPNLSENILPTRGRAGVVLHKGPDHAVQGVRLRKV